MITHPNDLPKISYEEFKEINYDLIVPLDMKIDIPEFLEQIEPYRKDFRRWGEKRSKYPRYGISLKNLDGRIDSELDPACYPLDQWWALYPDKMYWDHDFKVETELMNLPCMRALEPVREHMIRSSILRWDYSGHLVPHVDIKKDYITHFRLWGTNTDDNAYSLLYGNQVITDFEPGRLYMIDTTETHSAIALDDDVYTFFIALDLTAKDTLISPSNPKFP